MTDLEALQRLQERAQSFARPLQIGAAFAMVGLGVALYFGTLLAQLALTGGEAWPFGSGLVAAAGAAVVPKSANWFIRKSLERRRPRWIDELVRSEGVSRAELEELFTLDAW